MLLEGSNYRVHWTTDSVAWMKLLPVAYYTPKIAAAQRHWAHVHCIHITTHASIYFIHLDKHWMEVSTLKVVFMLSFSLLLHILQRFNDTPVFLYVSQFNTFGLKGLSVCDVPSFVIWNVTVGLQTTKSLHILTLCICLMFYRQVFWVRCVCTQVLENKPEWRKHHKVLFLCHKVHRSQAESSGFSPQKLVGKRC